MDRDTHSENLSRMSSVGLKRVYEQLVDQLGAGFMEAYPKAHGHIRYTLRFSRGRLNPIDFIVNEADLRCYFRGPLFFSAIRTMVQDEFPGGQDKGRDYSFRFDDMETCGKIIRFVNGTLRRFIEGA